MLTCIMAMKWLRVGDIYCLTFVIRKLLSEKQELTEQYAVLKS